MIVINICGENGVGKSTVAKYLNYELALLGKKTCVLHLADKVKRIAGHIIGEDSELYHDRYTKDQEIKELYISRRQILCNITEVFIKYVNCDYWWQIIDYYLTYNYVIIPDCRYKVWLDFLVKRQHKYCNYVIVKSSNECLEEFSYLGEYVTVVNDGNEKELEEKVKYIAKQIAH
jgi:gluconate kinase